MNNQTIYMHLGDTVGFYQEQATAHPSSNSQIVEFQGHVLQKIPQSDMLKCTQQNCHFAIAEKNLAGRHAVNSTFTPEKLHWLDEDKASEAMLWVEHSVKQIVAKQVYTMMQVNGFNTEDPEFTQEKVLQNMQIQSGVKLNKDYIINLLLNSKFKATEKPCPYLISIFDKKLPVNELITPRGITVIINLITDIMKQQDINIDLKEEANNKLSGRLIGTNSRPYVLVYDLDKYIAKYNTAFEALSELIKEVEFDKILVKISKLYPDAFYSGSRAFIHTWDWHTQTIGFKKDGKTITISISTFCDVENMVFDFDMLKMVLNSIENEFFEDVFRVSTFSAHGRSIGTDILPRGRLSPDMFVRFPLSR